MHKGLLSVFDVLRFSLATPRFEDRSLESSAIGEGDLPGSEFLWEDVHRVQVLGSLEFSLTTREEGDTGHGWGHGSSKGSNGSVCDLSSSCLLGAVKTWSDHVGLEEGSFKIDVVVAEGLVDGSQHSLGNFLADFDAVVAVDQNLRFDDGNKSLRLADRSVSGQDVCVLEDALRRGSSASILDSEHASPLGKVAAVSLVLLASLGKAIETLSGAFVLGSEKWDDSLVDLDSEEDTAGGKVIDESLSFVVLLVDGLVEKNNATDGLFKSLGGGEKELSVLHSVLFVVLDSDGAESLADSTSRFISGKDTFSVGNDLFSDSSKLGLEFGRTSWRGHL